MSSPTELHLPPTFPYPIKVVSLDVHAPASIERGTRLLSYSFVHISAAPASQPETRFGTWDSAVAGTVDSWKIKQGDVISERKARERAVVVVTEPCKHGVQIGGLCGLCGKDMTDYDYTGFSDASRASIQMTHSAFGPTVSLEEAQRIERETAEHLLKSRKLSLIVDLDQTIVHATVDPTVGEWISEGEAWEARRAKKASGSKKDEPDDTDDTTSEPHDECNPNWEALKDVKKFRLGPESFGPPSVPAQYKGKGKSKLIENEGCMYYIKPRPGWKDFLSNMATKYEMHVYTMGTRAYAEEVCSAIDPDSKIFGGRILSRDESGSLTQKSLQRLFPCDTSMVVIIDDRADVWEWSPNLVKVIPYDFFVGIGDINSTFLPKVDALAASIPPHQSTGDANGFLEESSTQANISQSIGSPSPPSAASDNRSPHIPEDTLSQSSPDEKERTELTTKAMLTQNSLALEAQLEERPLAKKQEALQDASKDFKSGEEQTDIGQEGTEPSDTNAKEVHDTASSKVEKVLRKALLKNDDTELERVSKLLEEVHSRFFRAYDDHSSGDKTKKRRPRSSSRPQVSYDVTNIIPRIRAEILQGVHILFSSVIPLDTKAESTEIWRMAHMFGARCSTELTSEITHVVAAKRGTVKVDSARKRKGVKIVWLAWFTDSIALWHHQDEVPYLLDDPSVPVQSSSPTLDSNQTSSEPEPDTDDWDDEQKAPPNPRLPGFELDGINWDDINDEVNAAMNESDDEDDKSQRSGNVSEDDWTDETNSVISVNNSPRLKRKRLRSVTPSETGMNGSGTQDSLHSPLAKRKKLASERTGYSKLKQAISADDLTEMTPAGQTESRVSSIGSAKESVIEDDGDDEGDEEYEDDDFLARELGEEDWG